MGESTLRELDLSERLNQTLKDMNVFLATSEVVQRKDALSDLENYCNKWINKISKHKYPLGSSTDFRGKLFTFGSYRLEVDLVGADIDAIFICPKFINKHEFFGEFYQYLSEHPDVVCIDSLKCAYVPLIKMKFNNIRIDLLFASINKSDVPNDLDLNENTEELMRTMDIETVRSISGVRVSVDILNMVPNLKVFQLVLRVIKLWSKRRRIYSNAMGFLGGCSWTILVAEVCKRYPTASAFTIIVNFFDLFGNKWDWKNPVILKTFEKYPLHFTQWNPSLNSHHMPIITPSYPCLNSSYNVTIGHKKIITNDLKSAYKLCRQISDDDSSFQVLFDKHFFFVYQTYLMVTFKDDNKEFTPKLNLIESRLRILVQNIETHSSISLVHLYTKHVVRDIFGQSVCRWFIGYKTNMPEFRALSFDSSIAKFGRIIRPLSVKVNCLDLSNIFQYLSEKDQDVFKIKYPTLKNKRNTNDDSCPSDLEGIKRKRY